MDISARFTVKPRKIKGKTFHLACNFCVFSSNKEATDNLNHRMKIYTNMNHRVIELPKSQQLINFDNRNKPLKYAVFEAYKDKGDEPKSQGLKELFK